MLKIPALLCYHREDWKEGRMKSGDFTEGKIIRPLIGFLIPIVFTMLLQTLYGAVDLLIVGQFSDDINVAGVTIGGQIMATVTFMITDLSLGTTVILGQLLGQKRAQECGRVIGATISMFVTIGLAAAVLTVFAAEPLARIMNTPEAAMGATLSYLRICGAGTVFIVGYNVVGSIFRGIGNSKIPLMVVIVTSILNVAGDLLLVAYFHMGSAGAAIATVAAQGLGVAASVIIVRRSGMPFPFKLSDIGYHWSLIKQILKLGIPVALQDLLVSISFLVIMAIVNQLGVTAAAGIGIAERLCSFIMLVPSSFAQAMSSFVAQNYGARKMDRAARALLYAMGISFLCSIVLGYTAFFHGVEMSGIFSPDLPVCIASAEYLKGYAIDCLLTAFLFCFIGFYNGCGRTRFVMVQGIVGAFCVRVPVSYLMSLIEPVSIFRISLATPASSAVQICVCVIYLLWFRRNVYRD